MTGKNSKKLKNMIMSIFYVTITIKYGRQSADENFILLTLSRECYRGPTYTNFRSYLKKYISLYWFRELSKQKTESRLSVSWTRIELGTS